MTEPREVPAAIVQRPRPPLTPTPGRAHAIRTWISVGLLVVAAGVGWRWFRTFWRGEAGKAHDALVERVEQARAKVGHGLDPLLDAVVDADGRSVGLVATLDVDPQLGRAYSDFGCSWGFDDAFELALGKDVVSFSSLGMNDEVALRLRGKVTPSGRGFQLPNSDKVYPGIAMDADMTLFDQHVHAQVRPGEDITFKHVRIGIELGGLSDDDVAGGIMQGTCKEAGLAVIEALTPWRRPAPPPPPDPATECLERGFHCADNARALEATDPGKAAKLYAQACDHDDDHACVRAGELELSLSSGVDDHRARAEMGLEMACARELVGACAAAARVKLRPLTPTEPISDAQRQEALTLELRACDLGDRDACAAAVPLVKGTRFAEAAPVLAGKVVASKRFGTIHALRWGQWTHMDRGQPTLWVTHPPAGLPGDLLVTEFTADRLPPGITMPPGADKLYAIAADRGSGSYDDACGHCMPSGGGDSIYRMRSLDCVCAVVPHE